jgi:hypothetical protein
MAKRRADRAAKLRDARVAATQRADAKESKAADAKATSPRAWTIIDDMRAKSRCDKRPCG